MLLLLLLLAMKRGHAAKTSLPADGLKVGRVTTIEAALTEPNGSCLQLSETNAEREKGKSESSDATRASDSGGSDGTAVVASIERKEGRKEGKRANRGQERRVSQPLFCPSA